MTADGPVRARALVSGRVQGVCFRVSTLDEARALELAGWVRNLSDGRVEWEAEGSRDVVERLISWSWKGPAFSRVESVEVEWIDVESPGPGFEIRG